MVTLSPEHPSESERCRLPRSWGLLTNEWCTCFMNLHGLHPTAHAHCSEAFQRCRRQGDKLSQARGRLKSQQFDLKAIGNMDETPMFFDMPGNRTVDVKKASTVSIKISGAEKQHFTFILSCLAGGTKLKPAVVFKRKKMPKEKLPRDNILFVQEKGWVDERVLFGWLKNVWFKRPSAPLNEKSMLA